MKCSEGLRRLPQTVLLPWRRLCARLQACQRVAAGGPPMPLYDVMGVYVGCMWWAREGATSGCEVSRGARGCAGAAPRPWCSWLRGRSPSPVVLVAARAQPLAVAPVTPAHGLRRCAATLSYISLPFEAS